MQVAEPVPGRRLFRPAAGSVLQRDGCGPSHRGRRRTAGRRWPDHPVRSQPGRPGHLRGAAPLGRRPGNRPGSIPGVLGVDRQSGEQLRRQGGHTPARRLPVSGHRGDPAVRRMGGLAHRHDESPGGGERGGGDVHHPRIRLLQRRPRRPRQHPVHPRRGRRQPRKHHLRLRSHQGAAAGLAGGSACAAAESGPGPCSAPDRRSGLPPPHRAGRRGSDEPRTRCCTECPGARHACLSKSRTCCAGGSTGAGRW